MKQLALLIFTTFLFFSCSVKNKQEEKKLPNIVIIYADDMGYGDLGVQNPASKIPTPNLDKLASEGMRFTDGHSSSGICTPSRYAMLTGRYHWRKFHGIVNAFGPPSFDDERLTMPEMLQEKGYATACIGKWHLGWNWNFIAEPSGRKELWNREVKYYMPDEIDWERPIKGGPLSHGFDYYFGDDVPNFPPYTWIENEHVVIKPTLPLSETPETAEGSWEARPGPMAEGWELDAVMPKLTEKAVEYINSRKGKDEPFFLYFPWTSPHAPIVPTKEFQGTTKAGVYGDYMHQSDWTAGQVLKALEENGFAENTLVIFMTDNGPQQTRYVAGMRGRKGSVYRGGVRVPFYMRYPAKSGGNKDIETTTAHIDVLPTLAELCNAEIPTDRVIDGKNMVPLLNGNQVDWAERSLFFYWTRRYPELYNNIALQQSNYKLVGHTDYNAKIEEFELFDLQDDPYEQKNLVNTKTEIATSLKTELDRKYSELINSENLIHQPRIVIGDKNENPIFLNRNDADGERGIWAQEEIYGKWQVSIKEGQYNIRFKFIKPVDAGGQMILETGAIVNQMINNKDNSDIIEMKNVKLPEMDCELIPFYSARGKNILPFWVEIERIE